MAFFSLLACLLLIIAAGLFIPVFYFFIKTGLLPNFPTLIVSGFIEMAANISFFEGLLLDTMVQSSRRDFEFKLQLVAEQ